MKVLRQQYKFFFHLLSLSLWTCEVWRSLAWGRARGSRVTVEAMGGRSRGRVVTIREAIFLSFLSLYNFFLAECLFRFPYNLVFYLAFFLLSFFSFIFSGLQFASLSFFPLVYFLFFSSLGVTGLFFSFLTSFILVYSLLLFSLSFLLC